MERYLPKEKENRKISMGVSIGVHALLLILFLILAAWKEPYPPNPGIPGVELNFGLTDAGMGDVHKDTKANTKNPEDSKPDEAASPETKEDVKEQNTPEAKNAVVKGENIESSPMESDHKVKDQSDMSSKNSNDQQITEAAKPKTEKKDSPKDGGSGTSGESSTPASSSNGDKNVMGDQGSKEGKVDSRALYGTPGTGGGGGPKLDLAGWDWGVVPDKPDPYSSSGFVEFEFVVDERGLIEPGSIKMIKTSLTHSAVQFYRKQLEDVYFKRSGSGDIVKYKGRVRFEVVSQ